MSCALCERCGRRCCRGFLSGGYDSGDAGVGNCLFRMLRAEVVAALATLAPDASNGGWFRLLPLQSGRVLDWRKAGMPVPH